MLTRNTPDTLRTAITVVGQGVPDIKFNCTFRNYDQDEINAKLQAWAESPENEAAVTEGDFQYPSRMCLLHVVKDWETEYELTDADIREMERKRPGMIELLFIAYHKARRVEGEKNS